MAKNYDVIILGSGPAGFSCAMQSAKFGKSVLIVEADSRHFGGTWINTGTVPSKALREAAKTIHDYNLQFGDFDNRKPYERFHMSDLLRYKDQVLENENKEVNKDLSKNKIDTVQGYGYLKDHNTINVTDPHGATESYKATNILISTGSHPTPPDNFEIDHDKVLDTSSILNITHIPKRLAVVGAGVNSIEYATIFAALGSRVTILNEMHHYLPFLDNEIHQEFTRSLTNNRITVYAGVTVEDVSFNPLRTCTEVRYTQDKDGELRVIETDHVLYFGGRRPNTDKIALDNVGIEQDEQGYIKVNENYQSSTPNIYAAGDVIGFPALASASFSQGRQAACHMFDIPNASVQDNIPFGIYSIPSVASIGLSEQQAQERGINYEIGRAYYGQTTQADITNNKVGMLKIVFDADSLQLLGVHIVGENSTELVHIGQAVMAHKGNINYFVQHVLNYPTYSEAYRIAAFNGINRVYKLGYKYKETNK